MKKYITNNTVEAKSSWSKKMTQDGMNQQE